MSPARIATLLLTAAFGLAGSAHAQLFSEDFESYPDGSLLDGQGGWRGWDGLGDTVSTVTSANAFDGTQALAYSTGTDVIQEFDLHSGRWVITANVFIPSGLSGGHWLVFLNQYDDAGPYEWGGQIEFDSNSGMLRCDCGGTDAAVVPMVVDAWAEVRLVVDIDNDQAELSYDGNLLVNWVWTSGFTGAAGYLVPGFEAFDIWSPDGSATAYVDAIEIRADLTGTTYCVGDGSGTLCPCGNDNDGSLGDAGCANGSSSGGGALTASGSASLAAGDLQLDASGLAPNQPGLYFQGDNALAGGDGVLFGDGLRCAGANVVRLQVLAADAGGVSSSTVDIGVQGGVSAGETKRYQLWYRDPAGSPCGNSFNLTNGFEVDWMP